jgi:RNA polymerase sigma factor (sigma-70 family)
MTALKFKVIDAYRAQQLHYSHIDKLIIETREQPMASDDQLDRKELKKRILRATGRLPEKCREVFLMSRFEQLSHQEIADKAGISVSTVKKHLHRAMDSLRKEFSSNEFDVMIVCMLIFLR